MWNCRSTQWVNLGQSRAGSSSRNASIRSSARERFSLRVGVRQAQVVDTDPAERRAGEDGHAGLVEQPPGELVRAEACLRDVREGVERAQRCPARDAREPVRAPRPRAPGVPGTPSSSPSMSSIGPCSAATPASWTNGGTHDVELTKKRDERIDQRARAPPRSRTASRSSRTSSRSRRAGSSARASPARSRSTRTRPRRASPSTPRPRAPRHLSAAIISAAATRSSRPATPPVGFCGELRMTSFVRGLSRASSSAGSKTKSRSSCSGSGTGFAPTQLIADS